MHSEYAVYIKMTLFLAFLIPFIFFFYAQYRTIESIQPQFRRLHPGQVWFQLIPFFGLLWQFFVIVRLSDSIRNQLTAPTENSLFEAETLVDNRPTLRLGIAYAILFCVAVFPLTLLKVVAAATALFFWVAYWNELNRYRQKINSRNLLSGC